jgi:hypothetical protein
MQVLDAACGSALSAGSDQRPVDPAAAPLRQCRPAQQAGEAVSAWLEESQPPRGDNVTIGLRGQDPDVMRGGGDPGDEVLAVPVPVLAPQTAVCSAAIRCMSSSAVTQRRTTPPGRTGTGTATRRIRTSLCWKIPMATGSASST